LAIPESPRWLVMKNRAAEAKAIMERVGGQEHAEREYANIVKSLAQNSCPGVFAQARELFSRRMKLILIIGVGLGVFQQVSGINSVLYYAPMIFESAGNGRNAAFLQASAIGVVFLVMTVVSMLIIDRLGRKPLLYAGVSMMALSLLITGFAFWNASYRVDRTLAETAAQEIFKSEVLSEASKQNPGLVNSGVVEISGGYAEIVTPGKSAVRVDLSGPAMQKALARRQAFVKSVAPVGDRVFSSEFAYRTAIETAVQRDASCDPSAYVSLLLKTGIHIDSMLVLVSILGFIAGFSISLGPVMWAMFSEIFPNRLRGLAISFVGTVNSTTSFVVATLFPVQLSTFGSSATFFIYAACMLLCLVFVWKYVIETKGKSLEELEAQLMR